MIQMPTVIEAFIERGMFTDSDTAITEMARSYTAHHIQRHQATIKHLQAQYGMTYEQFTAYLRARAEILAQNPDPALNEAVMQEEEDALEWKIALEMLHNWLSIQAEASL
jgi:hypothetical protein